MHAPRDCHLAMLKHILRYLKGTSWFGMQLHGFSTPTLTAYADPDWAGCQDTRRSTSGFCVFFNLVTLSSHGHLSVSRPCHTRAQKQSTEASQMPSRSAHGFGISSASCTSSSPSHDSVLRQHLLCLYVEEPCPPRTKEAHRARRALRARESGPWRAQGSTRSKLPATGGRFHQRPSAAAVQSLVIVSPSAKRRRD